MELLDCSKANLSCIFVLPQRLNFIGIFWDVFAVTKPAFDPDSVSHTDIYHFIFVVALCCRLVSKIVFVLLFKHNGTAASAWNLRHFSKMSEIKICLITKSYYKKLKKIYLFFTIFRNIFAG